MLLWTTHVTERHLPLLAGIKAAGYDGIEVPMFEGGRSTTPGSGGGSPTRGWRRPPSG